MLLSSPSPPHLDHNPRRRLRPRQSHSAPGSSPTRIAEPCAGRQLALFFRPRRQREYRIFLRADRRAAGRTARVDLGVTSPISIRRYRETADEWSSAPIGQFREDRRASQTRMCGPPSEPIAAGVHRSTSPPSACPALPLVDRDRLRRCVVFQADARIGRRRNRCERRGQDQAMQRRSRTPTSNVGRAGART